MTRPRWGGHRAALITATVLARDRDPRLGYAPCFWCGDPASTADHWPVARIEGAPDTAEACVAACRPCNLRRGGELSVTRRRPPPPSRQW